MPSPTPPTPPTRRVAVASRGDRKLRLRHGLVGVVIAVLVGGGLVSAGSPAAAAPRAPTGLSPTEGTSVASSPVLSWSPVSGATSYRVELSTSASYDSLAYTVTTANRQATPKDTLPSGELYWRVRAVDVSGAAGPWSATAGFTLDPKSAPVQLSPSPGESLPQPEEPPLLTWGTVDGAVSYELSYGTDPALSTASTLATKNTSYAFTTPQAQATYYWKVRAVLGNGQATVWSDIQSYDVASLDQPVLKSPDNSPDTVVTDVVLEWRSVPGASRYEVRVSTDRNFTTTVAQSTTVATRWSPPTTLDNDQYWWQVRAYDSQNQTKDWTELSQTWQFERRWQFGDTSVLSPERPALVYPADAVAPVTEAPFFYEWEPVRLASEYKLQVGPDANFSPGTFDECATKQTTFTPRQGVLGPRQTSCMPGSGGTYYWRVQGVDQPKGVVTPWSDIRAYTYRPGSVPFAAPADGATVPVPTMSWGQVLGAERYKLTYSYGTGAPRTVLTYSNSYTPTTRISTSTPTVSWFVQAVYANGDVSARPLAGSRTFTIGPPPTNAEAPDALAADSSGDRFPSLSWMPVADASYYKVFVGTAGTGTYQELPDKFAYPAGTDLTRTQLSPKAYDWFVRAFNASNIAIGTGSSGSYSIQDIGAVSGQGVAHTGTELDGPLRCTVSLSDGTSAEVCSVRQTPVLDWDPVVGASFYQVTLARDESLTNPVYPEPVDTDQTRWTPPEQLPDSQAGEAYYWVVRPCKAVNVCGPDPTRATNAFDKTSHTLVTTSPPDNAVVEDAVTFSWTDYLDTNTAQPASTRSRVEARQYRIEVSTSTTFQTILDTATVDQTTYTAPSKIYPEGPLFWRVSALDGSGNRVGTSPPQAATKQSPPVRLVSPTGGSRSSATPSLRWEPRPFTASYDVEVYKNGDFEFSSVNRVVSVNSKLTAYSLTTPLPAADPAYVWRVRSKDVSGNPGPWSPGRSFTIQGSAPQQLAPSAGVRVDATASLFTWSAVPGATSYRFERRPSSGTTATETVGTVGLAWAPTSKLSDGSWDWRVSTLDAAGKVVATSPWRTFTVDGTAPTIVARTPSSSAVRRTNVSATLSEPVGGVTTGTMRLYLKGRAHPVSADVDLSASKLKAVLDPAKNLLVGRTYRAVLTSGITDGAGNPLVRSEWTFVISS